MKFKEHLPEYLVLFLSIVFATLVTFDLQLNYPHWEMYTYIEHFAMDTQPEFNFTNDIQGLIRPELDGLASRPRFFSWYVSVINAKLRFLLF